MKKLKTLLIVAALFLGVNQIASAQAKIAHVDVNEIMTKMPAVLDAQKQLEKNKKKLLKSGQVRKEELDMICQKQAELTKLENEIEQQLETKIEIPPKDNN